MAELGATILASVFQLCLLKYMLKYIHLNNRTKLHKTFEALGDDSRTKSRQKSAFYRAAFREYQWNVVAKLNLHIM